MAFPLTTVESWVPNITNPRILFITENYPKNPNAINGNTYFYRCLIANIKFNGANNLLNNLCFSLGVKGSNEITKLNEFLNVKKYFVIDTFPNGVKWNKQMLPMNPTQLLNILTDIQFLNPQQIIFTGIQSNGAIYQLLSNLANHNYPLLFKNVVKPIDKNGNIIGNVFRSSSNRWITDQNIKGIPYDGFRTQIDYVLKSQHLIP